MLLPCLTINGAWARRPVSGNFTLALLLLHPRPPSTHTARSLPPPPRSPSPASRRVKSEIFTGPTKHTSHMHRVKEARYPGKRKGIHFVRLQSRWDPEVFRIRARNIAAGKARAGKRIHWSRWSYRIDVTDVSISFLPIYKSIMLQSNTDAWGQQKCTASETWIRTYRHMILNPRRSDIVRKLILRGTSRDDNLPFVNYRSSRLGADNIILCWSKRAKMSNRKDPSSSFALSG